MEEEKPQETAEQILARKKKAQAEAHARWRASPKGIAYYQRQKEKKALAKSGAV